MNINCLKKILSTMNTFGDRYNWGNSHNLMTVINVPEFYAPN